MASLKELKENKLYEATSRNRYYNINYDSAPHYANPLICSNCKHDFRTVDTTYSNFNEIIDYDYCPKCGEKFTEFINRDGNITSKNKK